MTDDLTSSRVGVLLCHWWSYCLVPLVEAEAVCMMELEPGLGSGRFDIRGSCVEVENCGIFDVASCVYF